MKKSYLTMLFAMLVMFFATSRTLLFANNAVMTDNVMTLSNEVGDPGQTVEFTISLDNVDPIVGFQVDVLPSEQITFDANSVELTERASSAHIVYASVLSTGALRILVYSMPAAEFSGNSGPLCTFSATFGDQPGTYPLQLANAVGSDAMGHSIDVSTADGSYTIQGAIQNYTINATANPANAGTITGTGSYEEGATAVLTAVANSGFVFGNWTENGTQVSTESTYSFTVSGDRDLVANFTSASTNILSAPNLTGEQGQVQTVDINLDNIDEVVGFQVDVLFNDGFSYVEESFELSNRASTSHVSMASMVDANTLRVIVYSMPPTPFSGNSGALFSFQVTLEGEGNYPLVLTDAILSDALGNEVPSETVDGSISITAPVYYTVTATANPANAGVVTGMGTFEAGQTATLVATANSGYTFINWTENGSIVATTPTYSFPVSADRDLVANFSEVSQGNVLSVSDVTGPAGSVVEVSVSMNNSDDVAAFQFDIPLNAQLTYVEGSASLTGRASENHQIAAAVIDGVLRVITYSMPASNFNGNEGAICTFDLQLGQTQGTYPLELNEVILSDGQGNEVEVSSLVDGSATITAPISGNVMALSNETGEAGQPVEFTLSLANVDPIVGFQVDILPSDQITFDANAVELTDRATSSHVLYASIIPSGALRILVYSMPAAEFSGNSGPICTFTATLGNQVGTYPLQITNAVGSDAMGQSIEVSTIDGSYTISTPGQNYMINATANPVNAGSVSGTGSYPQGATAVLTATANSGYYFQNWTENGTVVSSSPVYSFTVNADRSLVANFIELSGNVMILSNEEGEAGQPVEFTLSLENVDPIVGFQVDVLPSDQITFDESSVELTERATSSHVLYASIIPSGALRILVYSMPAAEFIGNSGPICTFTATLGNQTGTYPLQIANAVGSDAMGHSIEVSTIDGSYTISTPGQNYMISATANPVNAGTVSGTGSYPQGATAVLTATANDGYFFQNWTENGTVVSSNPVYSFTVNADRSLVANFIELSGNVMILSNEEGEAGQPVEFTISLENVDPIVGFQVDVLPSDQITFDESSVELTERATSSHVLYASIIPSGALRILVYSMPAAEFIGNSGPICTFTATLGNQTGTYPLQIANAVGSDAMGHSIEVSTIDGSYTISTPGQNYMISATANPVNAGTVSGTGSYPQGATAVLTATANDGYFFQNWTENGTVVSSNPVYSFTVNSNRSLVANFIELSGNVMVLSNEYGYVGQPVEFSISMANVDPIVGFQVDVLPSDQITFDESSVELTERATSSHVLYASIIPSGALRILVYSMPAAEFIGNSGPICTFTATLGTQTGTYPLQIANAVGSDAMGHSIEVSTIDGSYTIQVPGESYFINATANPVNAGTITGTGSYQGGTTATLVATANSGYFFQNWTENGNIVSTNPAYSFVVNSNRNLVANFIELTGNVLSLMNVTGNEGDVVQMSINLDNIDPIVGFQVDVEFNSDQVTYVAGSLELSDRATSNHVMYSSILPNGALRILVYSMPAAVFTGNSGALCTFDVQLGHVGGSYMLPLTNPAVSDAIGHSLPVTAVGGVVTISSESEIYNITAIASPANSGTITGAGQYAAGQTVVLRATANSGYEFSNWTENGIVVSTSTVYTFIANNNRNLVANFTSLPTYYVHATANPSNGGTVSGTGDNFFYGQIATLNANPNDGYMFINWTENGTIISTSKTFQLIVERNYNLKANFQLEYYTVSLISDPNNGGTLTGAGTYAAGTVVTINATPAIGYNFVNWNENGAVFATTPSYSFEITNSLLLIAHFELKSFEVTATVNPANTGTVEGTGTYAYGQTAILSAIPAEGYKFVSWTENGNTVSFYSDFEFIVVANRSFVANFVEVHGIEDVTSEDIFVYPNPTVGKSVIQSPAQMSKVTIVNGNGQIVNIFDTNNSTSYEIDMTSLSKGTYYIQIELSTGVITKKIVKM